MNSDFRVSVHVFQNPKIRRLQKLLGNDGVVSLFQLWAFTAAHRPNGVLTDMGTEDIEAAAGWSGEPERLANALATLRLLERNAGGTGGYRYIIHDWDDHNEYAFYAPERSAKARQAAHSRWARRNATGKERINGEQYSNDERAMLNASSSNAPSPAPVPDPDPSPDPVLHQRAGSGGPGENPEPQPKGTPRKRGSPATPAQPGTPADRPGPRQQGNGTRAQGTNPRAAGTNPRAQRTEFDRLDTVARNAQEGSNRNREPAATILAKLAGQKAGIQGVPREANHHPEGSREREFWDLGWQQAQPTAAEP